MDYNTPDGSQLSLREIWRNTERGDKEFAEFAYTTISANVAGKAYFGRLDQRLDDVDEGDVLSSLEPVPPEAIYPIFPKGLSKAPSFDPSKHYLKAPSFTWDDCQPGVMFVADCVINEVHVLERLESHQHPNIIRYHGCTVENGRVTHICLQRCQSNVVDYVERSAHGPSLQKLIQDIKAGIDFLHSLGLAHNDINPENICIVDDRAIIVDFDSCLPFGEVLKKGVSAVIDENRCPLSAAENDIEGLADVEDFLAGLLHGKEITRSNGESFSRDNRQIRGLQPYCTSMDSLYSSPPQ